MNWLVLILLEGTSLFLIAERRNFRESIFLTPANSFTSALSVVKSSVSRQLLLEESNRKLTERNVLMQRQIAQLREAVERLSHDSTETELILARTLRGCSLIPSRVIARSVWQLDNTLTIDRGSADGVKEGMGVVCGTGIVGIVTHVTPHRAQVMSILNSRSSIACRLRGTKYIGYLHWQGGNMLVATMDDVPSHARVVRGQAVETSGYSSVFPTGIFVGRVFRVGTSPDGLSLQLSVQLSTDMARLDEVMVVAER